MRKRVTHFEVGRLGSFKCPKWLLLLVVYLQFSACAKTPETAASKPISVGTPNIVLIIADDMGWGDLSSNGNTNLLTPNLDRLAKEGRSYPNFYVSAVCSPTRAELLSGRHAIEVGVTGTGAGRERINLGVELLPEVLAKAGYHNGLFGKWHNGTQAPYHPLSRGFDEFYGFTSGHWGSYFDYFIEEGNSIGKFEGYLPDVLTTKAISFLAENKQKPSFTMLAFPTPHSPMQVPGKWFDPFAQRSLDSLGNGQGEEDLEFSKAALAMVENVDWNVGRVLNALDSLALTDNTLVIFMSDNGPNNWRWNGGMKGRKGSVDEGGVRSPLFMRWPKWSANVLDYSTVSVRDIFPTILSIVNVQNQQPDVLVGRDILKGLYVGVAAQSGHVSTRDFGGVHVESPPIINQWRDQVSVRFLTRRLDPSGNLYRIDTDRGQNEPVLDEKEMRANLMSVAERFRESILEPHLKPDTRPFTVGHESLKRTFLPARDAISSGGVSRSNRWPNDSYFDRWEDEDARIDWNVEVIESGLYEVKLFYTLADECKGTRVTFSTKADQLESSPLLAHFPGIEGQENDRILREESYVKDWKKETIGRLNLSKGIDTFSLSAQLLPGRTGPEVWAIELQRIN